MHAEELEILKSEYQGKPLSRRDFVRVLSGSAGLITAGLAGFTLTASQRAEAMELVIEDIGKLPTVPYGKLPFKVTPICICQDWNRELFAPALAVGVNFIHKAGYWGENVPDEIKKLPRESYYTDITVDNTPRDPDNYDRAYNQVKDSLAKNGLKYYDVFRAHFGWRSPEKVKPENNVSYKAFLALKKEGLVKHFGVSQHPYNGGEENAEKYAIMTQACIDSGIITTMQVWYSYGYPKEIMEIFGKASQAGIAMTAMKINAHGRGKMTANVELQKQMKAEGMVGRALIRNVMSEKRPDGKPIFQTCVSALHNQQQFEENMGGVSQKIALRDGFDRFHYAV